MVAEVVTGVLVAVTAALFLAVCKNQGLIELNREVNRSQNVLLDYVELLHAHGVDSHEAREFKLGHTDDELFIRRSQVMDRIFTMKEQIWEGHKRNS